MKSKKRTQHIAFCRQVAMYLCRKLTDNSFPVIGEHFGRDHSTVIHAYNLIMRRVTSDSAFRLSVTTIEEQGILESFSRLPQAEREIVRQLLDEFGSQRVAAIRFPVPFGPKSINERRRFLSPIYKLIRYHRLIFDSVADGVFRSTYLPWIDSITQLKAGEKRKSNYA